MKPLRIALIALTLTTLASAASARQTVLWLESVSHDCTFAPDDTIRMNIRLDSNQIPVDQLGMALVYNSADFDVMRVDRGDLIAGWPGLTASVSDVTASQKQITISGGGPAIPSGVSGYLATVVFVFKHCGPSLSTYHYQLCWTQLFGDFDESVQDVDERCGYIDVFPTSSNTGRITVESLYHTCSSAEGDTVETGIRLEQTDTAVDAAGFDLPYAPSAAFEYVGFKRGDLTAAWPFFDVAVLPGIIRVGGFTSSAIPAGSTGVFVTLRFVMHCCGSTSSTTLCTLLLVDDFAGMTAVCGALNCTPLATRPANWGYVKSLYR
jgi:hypothetical protein